MAIPQMRYEELNPPTPPKKAEATPPKAKKESKTPSTIKTKA